MPGRRDRACREAAWTCRASVLGWIVIPSIGVETLTLSEIHRTMHAFANAAFNSGRAARTAVGALLAVVVACAPGPPEEGRGAGLADARLSARDQAQSYGAALGTAFELGPDLSLLLDPAKLPRGLSDAPQDSMAPEVTSAMVQAGVIQGSCAPRPGARERYAPICDAPIPGYVVRVSDVYRLGRDSLQLHVLIRRYDTPKTGPHSEFAFEEAYQLAKQDGAWKVVRKARLARSGG